VTRNLPFALVGAAALVALTGCSFRTAPSGQPGGSAAAGPGNLVGILMPTRSSGRWASDGQLIVNDLTALGRQTDLQFAQDDIPVQVTQIDRIIGRGAKVLIVAAIDGTTLTDALREAGDANIRVVAYDTFVTESPAVDYYVTFDSFKVGVLQARSIESGLGLKIDDGPFNIELFAGAPDDIDAEIMLKGAMSILQPYLDNGKLVVRSGQTKFAQVATLRSDPAAAGARMDTIVRSDYETDRIDAVLSPSDGMSQGIIASLKEAGYYSAARPGPIVTGRGAEVTSIKSILAGDQTSTVFEDSRLLAAQAATMAAQILAGGTVETNDTATYNNGAKIVPSFLVDTISLDRSNAQKELVDSGYYKAPDLR
jgi:putative multiple sugar transport system substrate-binding protein